MKMEQGTSHQSGVCSKLRPSGAIRSVSIKLHFWHVGCSIGAYVTPENALIERECKGKYYHGKEPFGFIGITSSIILTWSKTKWVASRFS